MVNELGQISIDTARIIREDLQMVEITNGSIYCACMKGNFIQALIEMSAQNIEVLLIENSGMADPANIHRVLTELGDRTETPYIYCGSICIVDATSFLKYVKVLNAVTNQVKSSDRILVNKIDMVDDETLSKVHDEIFKINTKANITDTTYANIPLEAIKDEIADNGYDDETTNRCYNKPLSYVLTWQDSVEKDSLSVFINSISDEMYRIKGDALTTEGWYQVDAVDETVNIQKEDKKNNYQSHIVVICKGQPACCFFTCA